MLTRLEGEGALFIRFKDQEVKDVRLKIYEPPRFFEAFLRGHDFRDVPDITARICGVCPVAYQMSSCQALESALSVKVEGQLRALRRLLYWGEWIESHVLHVFMLHAPDFLGYSGAVEMAKDMPEIVQRGLKLKKLGNQIVTLIGGREIHPVNVRVGGFYRVPTKEELSQLLEPLKWAREAAIETVRWVADFEFPGYEHDCEFVALRHSNEYPILDGRVVSNLGLNIAVNEYEDHFVEEQVSYSNALHSRLLERGSYLVGPVARFNLNFDHLSAVAQEVAISVGLKKPVYNPFQSIIVRAIEILNGFDEAIRLVEQYEPPESSYVQVEPHAATGYSATEAPRGILYHRYSIDEQGLITSAKIVPPTSQNQATIENDLRRLVIKYGQLHTDELTWRCEHAIRNYDPCISCATHFLKLDIARE